MSLPSYWEAHSWRTLGRLPASRLSRVALYLNRFDSTFMEQIPLASNRHVASILCHEVMIPIKCMKIDSLMTYSLASPTLPRYAPMHDVHCGGAAIDCGIPAQCALARYCSASLSREYLEESSLPCYILVSSRLSFFHFLWCPLT